MARSTFTLNLGVLKLPVERSGHIVEAAATVLRDEIVQTMEQADPTGRTYRVPGTATEYRASAPGEPPAVREGRYRDSWKTSTAVRQGTRVAASAYTDLRVGSSGQYVLGELLEFGTVKMAPRPHVRPAIETAKPKINALVREASGA